MRIAVFHSLPCGGAKKTVYEFSRLLAQKHRIELYNFSFSDESMCDMRPLASKVHTYDFKRLAFSGPLAVFNPLLVFLNLWRLDRLFRRMAGDIDRDSFDAVFAHACDFDYTINPPLLRYLITPVLYYCQEPLRRIYEKGHNELPFFPKVARYFPWTVKLINKLYRVSIRLYDRWSIRSPSAFVECSSAHIQKELAKYYGIKAHVNNLGFDPEVFKPLGLGREHLVLSVGHFAPNKAHDFVVNALALIPEDKRPAMAIASPSLNTPDAMANKEYVSALAKKLNVRLEIYERLDPQELARLYNRAKVLACGYINEPFGCAVIESLACGTPVVAINEGGPAETVISGRNGFLVERSADKFAAALSSILDDEALFKKISEEAQRTSAERFSWQRAVDQLEKDLGEALKLRS